MMKKILAKTYLWFLLALLYSPILIIMIFSFTEAKVLGNWTGFSTKLYSSLFSGGMLSSSRHPGKKEGDTVVHATLWLHQRKEESAS